MTNQAQHQNSATIQVSGITAGERQLIPCRFQSVTGTRLAVASEQRVSPSTALTVEYNDALFLGEVVACTEDVTGTCHLEIKVEQVLTGLQSLINLRARLLGEAARSQLQMVQAVASR